MVKVGSRVLVSEDCREWGKATGQYGVYEGDFPLTVVFGYQSGDNANAEWKPGEYSYEAYKDGSLKLADGRPVSAVYREWLHGEPCPLPFFAMPMENPRIRLDDGSVIWGCQCWWGEADDGVTLEEAQEQTEAVKVLIGRFVEHFRESGASR